MPVLSIYLDADGMLKGINLGEVIQVTAPIKVGAVPDGMQSGKPSIAFGFELPDGRTVFAQTSMRLFHTAAKAFAARYGWQDESEYSIVDGQDRKV